MNAIPYDIIYNIFFHVDDYETLLQFWTLDKVLYNCYLQRYNSSFKHTLDVLIGQVFSALQQEPTRKHHFHTDAKLMYKYVKNAIQNALVAHSDTNYMKRVNATITNGILLQGPEFIKHAMTVNIVKNKVVLKACPKKLLSFNKLFPYRYMNETVKKFETLNEFD